MSSKRNLVDLKWYALGSKQGRRLKLPPIPSKKTTSGNHLRFRSETGRAECTGKDVSSGSDKAASTTQKRAVIASPSPPKREPNTETRTVQFSSKRVNHRARPIYDPRSVERNSNNETAWLTLILMTILLATIIFTVPFSTGHVLIFMPMMLVLVGKVLQGLIVGILSLREQIVGFKSLWKQWLRKAGPIRSTKNTSWKLDTEELFNTITNQLLTLYPDTISIGEREDLALTIECDREDVYKISYPIYLWVGVKSILSLCVDILHSHSINRQMVRVISIDEE